MSGLSITAKVSAFLLVLGGFSGLALASSIGNISTDVAQNSEPSARMLSATLHPAIVAEPITWIQQKVVASDGVANDGFGGAVAVAGDTAIIGASQATANGNTPGPGAAYVFTKKNGVWSETQKLTPSDGRSGDNFGYPVVIEGNTVFIGSQQAPFDPSSGPGPGAVYVFTETNGVWTQTQKITASGGVPFDLFGHTIAPSGNTLFIGAMFGNAMYVFKKSTTIGSKLRS